MLQSELKLTIPFQIFRACVLSSKGVITVIIVYMCAWGGVVGLGYALLLPQLPLSRNGIACVV